MRQNSYRSQQAWLAKITLVVLGGLASCAPLAAQGSLSFFKNYFVTGDYAVAGVGLRGLGVGGFAQGNINMTAVPAGADVIAAFLYWQTVEQSYAPSGMNGFFRGKPIVGKPVGDQRNAACWNPASSPEDPLASARVYRADVLRYLPIDQTLNVRVGNGQHQVRLPDRGIIGLANSAFTNGASLVVVYRVVVPGNPAAAPLRSVVLYDGAYTMATPLDELNVRIGGFYQAADNAGARFSSVVGNGLSAFRTRLEVNQALVSSQAFTGTQGFAWDNPTFAIPLARDASSFRVRAVNDNSQTCITYGAIVASTTVVDSDADGLLDTWETNGMHLNTGGFSGATFGGCADYVLEPCVNLPRMGAVNGQKDIFVEIDWMQGRNVGKAGSHSHIPKLEALTQVIAAFKRQNIRLHLDVGANYQELATAPDFAIVPVNFAQGGQEIDEATLVCPNARTPASACTYTTPYPALSFKRGFASVRDGNASLQLPSRFSRFRKDTHHYALFGHAFAGPFDPATGRPLASEPRAISGVADRPGGDLMVTLGLWSSNLPENDQVGSATVQAGTFMHELGHNLGLSHAGPSRVPNCMPNYPSVMNYLYQTRGLTPLAGGDKVIDFSAGTMANLNEQSLFEPFAVTPQYRLRFYGPVTAADPPNSASQLRCDGSPITDGARMIRLENEFSSFVDWDHDLRQTAGPLRSDINFNGVTGDSAFSDSNDWRNVNLQQVGARLNVNGLSTSVGVSDLGVSDLGVSDLGALELGVSDLGVSDLGVSDLGVSDLGALELGDIDYDTAVLSSVEPPPATTPSCPTCGLRATNLIDRIRLTWTAPETGNVVSYNVYRNTPGNATVFALLRSLPGGPAAFTTEDIANGGSTVFNFNYTYYVTSLVNLNGRVVESSPSNTALGIVKRLFIAGLTASWPYGTPNPAVILTSTGLDPLAPSAFLCSTLASSTALPGTYPVTCQGPSTTGNPVNAIVYSPGVITIEQLPQTINFAALPARRVGDPPFTLTASASSGLPVTYTASGACTVSNSTVTLTGGGSCRITASQAGNQIYRSAPPVDQSFVIGAAMVNVLWYTGGVGTTIAGGGGTAGYQNGITTLANDAANFAPNRPWSVTFWTGGAMPAAPSGGWNVLVVASYPGPWSSRPDYTALNAAIGASIQIDPTRNRVMVTATDADWNYLNRPGPANFDGPKGFLINSINWAASGSGMGLVLNIGQLNAPRTAFSFVGFQQLNIQGNTVAIAPAAAQLPLNTGLSSAGLSNWVESFHSEFFNLDPSRWVGLTTDASPAGFGNFITIVNAPFASGDLRP